jgi:LemA protein
MSIAILLLIFIILLFAVILLFISYYNSFIKLRNIVKDAWSQILVQLKRRHDLIPNLMETVKGYVKHERETLENVIKARNYAMNSGSVTEKAKAESLLTEAMNRLAVVVENYPELKANENFMALQEELTSTENKISFARQNYNDQVLGYNVKVQSFPSNIIASMFNFKTESFFNIEIPAEQEVPKVSFS